MCITTITCTHLVALTTTSTFVIVNNLQCITLNTSLVKRFRCSLFVASEFCWHWEGENNLNGRHFKNIWQRSKSLLSHSRQWIILLRFVDKVAVLIIVHMERDVNVWETSERQKVFQKTRLSRKLIRFGGQAFPWQEEMVMRLEKFHSGDIRDYFDVISLQKCTTN